MNWLPALVLAWTLTPLQPAATTTPDVRPLDAARQRWERALAQAGWDPLAPSLRPLADELAEPFLRSLVAEDRGAPDSWSEYRATLEFLTGLSPDAAGPLMRAHPENGELAFIWLARHDDPAALRRLRDGPASVSMREGVLALPWIRATTC